MIAVGLNVLLTVASTVLGVYAYERLAYRYGWRKRPLGR